jgi:hypothetical protein
MAWRRRQTVTGVAPPVTSGVGAHVLICPSIRRSVEVTEPQVQFPNSPTYLLDLLAMTGKRLTVCTRPAAFSLIMHYDRPSFYFIFP